VGSLLPQAEGVEELVVDALHDLADAGDPPPQALGPHVAGVALGRAGEPRSVAIEPPEVVFGSLEALVGHVWPRAAEPTLMSLGFGQALTAKKIPPPAGRCRRQRRSKSP
jgi:hypothetical protein